MIRALTVGGAVLLAVLSSAAVGAQGSKNSSQGVFTEAQATRGQAAYMESCARCHAEDLLGGGAPPLVGETFVNRFGGNTADAMVKTIRRTMPQESPGSLTMQQYVDIASFLLKSNGSPAGADELPTDAMALQQIAIAGR
jgi:cytochrome c